MQIRKQTYIFDESIFEELLRSFTVSSFDLDNKLDILGRLRERNERGELLILTETRIEQTWNEQLFCSIFEYKSELMSGEGKYHILPKSWFGKNFNDFSLGFFSKDKEDHIVSAELKDPGYDLFKPQRSGSYAGKTPIEQAFDAANQQQTIKWVLVSNFFEILLFYKDDPNVCLYYELDKITTRSKMKRLLFALGYGGMFHHVRICRLEIIRELIRR